MDEKYQLLELIKSNKKENINKAIKIIFSEKNLNLNIKDENNKYLIQYIILYNQYELLNTIIEYNKKNISKPININLNVVDSDGRTILYNCINYGYNELLKILLDYDKTNIGVSIMDFADRLGYTPLHYSAIFGNIVAFKQLLDCKADPYITAKDYSNVFMICLEYGKTDFLLELINRKYNLHFLTKKNETLLQLCINFSNNKLIDILLEKNINLLNTITKFNLTALNQTIIMDNFEVFSKLINIANCGINIPDYQGNTPLHHILIDGKIDYFNLIIERKDLEWNISNINGSIPLDILLNSSLLEQLLAPSKGLEGKINDIILKSDLNIQNNSGETCFMKIIKMNLVNKFKDVLEQKPLNFFIPNNEATLDNEMVELLSKSYYNQIKLNSNVGDDWEKWCSKDLIDKLKPIAKTLKINSTSSKDICISKITDIIKKEKRSLPKSGIYDFVLDDGIFTQNCSYTGMPIDILSGLLLMVQSFDFIDLVIDYPLSINEELEPYYSKLNLDNPYKMDFSNIEILWIYQKIFYPTYFDNKIKSLLNKKTYVIIPLGIETSIGAHANILWWDVANNIIERFEPNGSNAPTGLNYNPDLLDSILETKFKSFIPNLKYYRPKNYLPIIGFQQLENLETFKCKKLGDPNGFCGVWCIWWVYQKSLNIDIKTDNFANELIRKIKLDNKSFKFVIRNFSKKITNIRDSFLEKIGLDINDWIVANYSQEMLDELEKNIYVKLNK